MITEHEVIYVLAFALMVSVLLAESYDRVHGGGVDRILNEEWFLIVLSSSVLLHTTLDGAAAASISCLNLRPVL